MTYLVYDSSRTVNYLNFEKKFVIKVSSRKPKETEKKILNPVYFNVGIYLIAPLLVGIFIGYKLDNQFRTKPLFVFAGIVLGTISSFYNLWKLTQE